MFVSETPQQRESREGLSCGNVTEKTNRQGLQQDLRRATSTFTPPHSPSCFASWHSSSLPFILCVSHCSCSCPFVSLSVCHQWVIVCDCEGRAGRWGPCGDLMSGTALLFCLLFSWMTNDLFLFPDPFCNLLFTVLSFPSFFFFFYFGPSSLFPLLLYSTTSDESLASSSSLKIVFPDTDTLAFVAIAGVHVILFSSSSSFSPPPS